MLHPALAALRACPDDAPDLKARYHAAQLAYEHLVDEELAYKRQELEDKIHARHHTQSRDKLRRKLDAADGALEAEIAAEITDYRNALVWGLVEAIHKLRTNGRTASIEKYVANSISRRGKKYFRDATENVLPNTSTNSKRRKALRLKLVTDELTEEQCNEVEHSKLKRVRGADQQLFSTELNGETPGCLNSATVFMSAVGGYKESKPYIPSRIAEQLGNEHGYDSEERIREELTAGFDGLEQDIFTLLAEGRSHRDVAEQLSVKADTEIKESTVRKVFDRLKARAIDKGMLPPEEVRQAS